MKYYVAALLMLMISHVLAQGDTSEEVTAPTTDEQIEADQNDLIMVMLQQIKEDVAELSTKTDNLQATTDSLQATTDSLESSVRNLNLKMRNIEDDVADFSEFKSIAEANFTAMMDSNDDVLQQINVLSTKQQNDYNQQDSDISSLENTVSANYQELRDLSTKQQSDHNSQDSDISSLEYTVSANYQELRGLSNKEQSDYNVLDDNISELEGTVQDNYQELRDDVDMVSRSVGCSKFNNGYSYEWVGTRMNWLDARTNCIVQGGDLAYVGFESISFREDVMCNFFKLCNNGNTYDDPWIGLTRLYSSNEWKYLDGGASPVNDGTWYSSSEYNEIGQDCAYVTYTEYTSSSHYLQTRSLSCAGEEYSICQFPC